MAALPECRLGRQAQQPSDWSVSQLEQEKLSLEQRPQREKVHVIQCNAAFIALACCRTVRFLVRMWHISAPHLTSS